MAQKTAALETAETSAIGRALANIGYSGDKRASREEMSKAVDPQAAEALVAEWVLNLRDAESIADLQARWEGAGRAGVTADARVIAAKDARKKALQ